MPAARSLPPLIEAFLDMIAAERGASKNTQDAYARDLADYAAQALPARERRRRTLRPAIFALICPRSRNAVSNRHRAPGNFPRSASSTGFSSPTGAAPTIRR